PCVDACPVNAISMNDINDPPVIDYDRCTGCGTCIAVCPGLAIFLVKIQGDEAFVSLPYEFLPIPKVGEKVEMLDREGKKRGEAEVMKVKKIGKTAVITVAVDKNLAMEVRNIRVKQV
ncbi:MAG TPA: 4Fe-4S dicluster domain-containing protein, partial [Thermoplasmata archaeon]|nr:4Fe-4S dicluster domain-containing protein [Thermoplasmata archaeon]